MIRACIHSLVPEKWHRSILPQAVCAFVAIVIVTAAVRLPLLDIPFERDEGEYAYIAWRLGFGELPYLDWFDQKPPAIFWIYRLALSLPINAISAVHLLAMLSACGSAFCVYLICRRFQGHGWGLIGGLTYAVFAADPLIQGTAANTEVFMMLPLLMSHLLFLRAMQDGKDGNLALLLMGILNGVAVACKQVALVNVLFMLAAYPALIGSKARLRKTGAFILFFTLGFALCWGTIILYFSSRHALDALIADVFTHNFMYVQAIPLVHRVRYFLDTAGTLARSQTLLWVFSVAGVAGTAWLGRPTRIYLLGWAVSSMVGISASGYYFPHYFQQGLPVLVILGVLGAGTVAAWCTSLQLWPVWRQIACAAMLILLPLVTLYPFLFRYSPAEAARKIYPGTYFAEAPEIATTLAKITRPAERIFIFGAEPQLFFYSRRASATRYIFLFPLYGPYGDALRKQLKAADEIAAARPELIVYSPNQLFFMAGSQQYFTAWTKQYLGMHYKEWGYLIRNSQGLVSMAHATGEGRPRITAGEALVGIILRKNPPLEQFPVESLASTQ